MPSGRAQRSSATFQPSIGPSAAQSLRSSFPIRPPRGLHRPFGTTSLMTALFQPFKLKDLTLRNRIAIPPMCQYSATDGVVNDWHRVHYPALARGGAGLLIVEATAVSPEGRITPGCLGLWNDTQAAALAPIAASIKAAGAVPGIQIGHAGRKASANRPWEGDDHIAADDARGWQTLSPSATAFGSARARDSASKTPPL